MYAVRRIINILVVWMATGLWHGAAWTFVAWGLLFAALLMIEKFWLLGPLKRLKGFSFIYVIPIILISFVLFDSVSLSAAVSAIGSMFGFNGLPLVSFDTMYYLKSYAIIIIIAAIGATPLVKGLVIRLKGTKNGAVIIDILEPILIMIMLVLCTAYLIDGSFNPFLYFRF